jgi:hypothetical protein
MVRNIYDCSLQGHNVRIKRRGGVERLKISFRRTVRVPDTSATSFLPPDLGAFPLYKVQDYDNKLPQTMVSKGGLFMPMYREYSRRPLRKNLIDRSRTRSNVGQVHRQLALRHQDLRGWHQCRLW